MMPESVNIPANSSVILPITITLDGSKLPQWPLVSTDDHTDANLKATELNGYISLTSESNPEINLGWMVKARNSTHITKQPIATEFPTYLGYNPDLGAAEWNHLNWAREHYGEADYQGQSNR